MRFWTPWPSMRRVPVFWPRASHCSSSESCIVFRLPEIPTCRTILRRPDSLHGRVVCRDPGHGFSDDEGVDVVGAFVGVDALDVGEVPEDRILVDDTVGAEGF